MLSEKYSRPGFPRFVNTGNKHSPKGECFIAPPGFEPGLQAPEARRLDHYLTGLLYIK